MEDNIDRLVEAYVKCRDHLKDLSKQFEKDEKEHKLDMSMIGDRIMKIADKQGVESFATKHGTAFKATKDWVSIDDWDVFMDYLIENDLRHMVQRRATKLSVKEYMEENDNQLPPGLTYGSKVVINVRRK